MFFLAGLAIGGAVFALTDVSSLRTLVGSLLLILGIHLMIEARVR
jgi:hypothetical protein